MKKSIRFLGGAGTVTGSKFLLTLDSKKILIDCGLFQGLKDLRLQNWAEFPVDPGEIDYVLITHAHLDHTGYLPILVRNGFSGKVYCTSPTRDLCKVILLDSAKILEEDAARANVLGYTKHHPAKPLYTIEDAQRSLRSLSPVSTDTWHSMDGLFRFRFTNSGHILGSALIEIEAQGFSIAFTGDLGRSEPLLLHPPRSISRADYLVIESTYGDRAHSPVSPLKQLAKVVCDTVERKGHVIIPSFAVGRTQDVLFLLSKLKEQSQIPNVPVFLDSPMGVNATEIFADYPEWHRLSVDEVKHLCKSVIMVKSQQQSEELLHRRDSSIVIAGSGMLSGGRVLNHLSKRLSDERNSVVMVGFQAASTRGSLLKSGIPELKIYGQYIPVKAHIEEISNLSAHGDQRDLLMWMGQFDVPPKNTFIVHGEPQASQALRVRVQDALQWRCMVPKSGEEVIL